MVTIAGWIPLLIDSLVAMGTLSLSVVAFLELREIRVERQERREREMVDRVYLPLRSAFLRTLELEMLEAFLAGEDYGLTGSRTWPTLKERFPYLVSRVPSELVGLLEAVTPLLKEFELTYHSSEILAGETLQASANGRLGGDPNRRDSVTIRLWGNEKLIGNVNPFRIWLEGKTPPEWAADEISKYFPPKIARFEAIVNGAFRGTTGDVEDVMLDVFRVLDSDSDANRMRTLSGKVAGLAQQILAGIDRELDRAATRS